MNVSRQNRHAYIVSSPHASIDDGDGICSLYMWSFTRMRLTYSLFLIGGVVPFSFSTKVCVVSSVCHVLTVIHGERRGLLSSRQSHARSNSRDAKGRGPTQLMHEWETAKMTRMVRPLLPGCYPLAVSESGPVFAGLKITSGRPLKNTSRA